MSDLDREVVRKAIDASLTTDMTVGELGTLRAVARAFVGGRLIDRQDGVEVRVQDSGRRDYFVPVIYMPGCESGKRYLVVHVGEGEQ